MEKIDITKIKEKNDSRQTKKTLNYFFLKVNKQIKMFFFFI